LGIKTPQVSSGNTHVYHQYVIEVSNREAFIKTMTEKGISTAVHYPKPLHLQPAYQNLGYKVGAFPIAEKASKAVISLPSFPELSDEEITFIIESVTQAIRS
jgi:dTDP-4-amino-4,6-dideoxygalactose transaminase